MSGIIQSCSGFLADAVFSLYFKASPYLLKTVVVHESVPLTPEEKIAKKGEIIEKAWRIFQGSTENYNACFTEVNQYFQGIFRTVCIEKKDAPLPVWFHAAKSANAEQIKQSGALRPSMAAAGYGVFLSTKDEFVGYGGRDGGLTFAIDDGAVRSQNRFYLWADTASWVAVEQPISITPATTAFIATEDTNINWAKKLNIHPVVLSRAASGAIHEVFEKLGSAFIQVPHAIDTCDIIQMAPDAPRSSSKQVVVKDFYDLTAIPKWKVYCYLIVGVVFTRIIGRNMVVCVMSLIKNRSLIIKD
jgi:hypothetical protein